MRNVIFYGLLIATFGLGGCSGESKIDSTSVPKSNRRIDLAAPESFIRENFKDKFLHANEEFSLDVASIDESGTITLSLGSESCDFAYELILVSRHAEDFDIAINSAPMSLQQVRKASEVACNVIGIDGGKLKDWFDSEEFDEAVVPSCLKIGEVNDVHHSMSVRRSFDEGKPWRMLYELSFTR